MCLDGVEHENSTRPSTTMEFTPSTQSSTTEFTTTTAFSSSSTENPIVNNASTYEYRAVPMFTEEPPVRNDDPIKDSTRQERRIDDFKSKRAQLTREALKNY